MLFLANTNVDQAEHASVGVAAVLVPIDRDYVKTVLRRLKYADDLADAEMNFFSLEFTDPGTLWLDSDSSHIAEFMDSMPCSVTGKPLGELSRLGKFGLLDTSSVDCGQLFEVEEELVTNEFDCLTTVIMRDQVQFTAREKNVMAEFFTANVSAIEWKRILDKIKARK